MPEMWSCVERKLEVHPCKRKLAKFAVENWHYSKKMAVGKCICFGVWENGKFIGALTYGYGTGKFHKMFDVGKRQTIELTRVALRKHDSPVSKIISVSLRQLRKLCPNVKLIVSFADPLFGHHGGIYQALGWIYTGCSQNGNAYLTKAGVLVHRRSVTKTGFVKQFGRYSQCKKAGELKKIKIPPKHRYFYLLDKSDKKLKEKLESMKQPYPRRNEHDVITSNVMGGAIPTSALQFETTSV